MTQVTELSIFIGKGGVGKTTVAAAYAVGRARQHPRRSILLLSTDPAHSLADVFEIRLGSEPKRIPLGRGQLWGWQINAQKQFEKFLRRYRRAIVEMVEQGTIFSRAEIEPLLDTTLPGMAEMSALLALQELLQSKKYDEIVVDTAPVGHTLRLFEMPEHFARFLDFLEVAGSRDRILAESFGGAPVGTQPVVREWRQMVEDVQAALARKGSRLVLVTTPEIFALNESVRAAQALAQSAAQLRIASVVLNRVVRPSRCRACGRRCKMTRPALARLRREFPRLPVYRGEDDGSPVAGASALGKFAEHLFEGKSWRGSSVAHRANRNPVANAMKVDWPRLETELSLTIGKGGVGKTTVSAGLAFAQRAGSRQGAVIICSTDPAPSLADIFEKAIGDHATAVLGDAKLRALEVDSVAEFRRWSQQMKDKVERAFSGEAQGVHVDLSFDRQVITALLDVVPPGVDEIFAIFRIFDLLAAGRQAVVIDMAPTGHALELLRMPQRMLLWSRLLLKSLAPHRTLPLAQDVAVEVAGVGQQVRELLGKLKDRRRARIWAVMLAEPLPDRETERLLAELEELDMPAAALFINRVIFPQQAGRCPRCRRASAWQMMTIERVRRRLGRRKLYLVPNHEHEIAGAARLKQLTSELWLLP